MTTSASSILASACAALLLAAGCGDPVAPEPLPAELEVGIGQADGTGFIAIADGADVELVPGAQGGFHIWVNVRVHGAAGELFLEREARRVVDDELVSLAIPQYIAVSDQAMDGWWDNPGAMPSFMCPAPLGIDVFDQELYFDVRLVDDTGAVLAADSMALTARCPDGPQADFCRQICSGAP